MSEFGFTQHYIRAKDIKVDNLNATTIASGGAGSGGSMSTLTLSLPLRQIVPSPLPIAQAHLTWESVWRQVGL
jgi:hypothetical protein